MVLVSQGNGGFVGGISGSGWAEDMGATTYRSGPEAVGRLAKVNRSALVPTDSSSVMRLRCELRNWL